MTTVSVQEATSSYDCKTPGCENEASSPVGRYSYCKPCQVARGLRPSEGKKIEAGTPAANLLGSASFAASAQELISAGKKADRARERLKAAQLEYKAAMAAYAKALEAATALTRSRQE